MSENIDPLRVELRAVQKRRFLAMCALLMGCVALHYVYVSRMQPDALYMDSLRLLANLDAWQQGKISFYDFWLQGTTHHGLVNQAFLWANVEVFELNLLLFNHLTGLVIAALALVIGAAFLGECRSSSLGALDIASLCLILVLPFGWAGVELLTLDLGLPLWFKNFAFVACFAVFDRISRAGSPSARVATAGLTLFLPLVVLLIGMGWSYAFVGALVAVQLLVSAGFVTGRRRRLGFIPLATAVSSLFLYIGIGNFSSSEGAATQLSVGTLAELPFYAVGSSWVSGEALQWFGGSQGWLFVSGAVTMVFALLSTARWLCRGAPGSVLPLLLVLYGGLVACSLAVGRAEHGPAGVVASRYFQDLVLFLVGSLWMAAREVRDMPKSATKLGPIVVVASFVLCVSAAHAATQYREWVVAPYRAVVFENMNAAVQRGVWSEGDAVLLQSPLADARSGARVLLARRIGALADLPEGLCSIDSIEYKGGWYQPEGDTRWLGKRGTLLIPPCECDLEVSFFLPGNMPARSISIERGGQGLATLSLNPGQVSSAKVPAGVGGALEVETSGISIPSRDLGESDSRELGALLVGSHFQCALPG